MKASFSLFLALRYLQPKRTFVSLISVISVLGVTLGIAVMILVISVMTGFDRELRRKVLGFEAHLTAAGEGLKGDWRAVDALLQKAPGVLASAPYVQGPVILDAGDRRTTPLLRGIDAARENAVTGIRSAMIDDEGRPTNRLDLEIDDQGVSNKVVLGVDLAHDLGVRVGDKITVYAPGDFTSILEEIKKAKAHPDNQKTLDELQQMVLPAELLVTGLFKSGRYQYDDNFMLTSLSVAQELYGLGDGVHGLSLRTADPYRVEEVKDGLYKTLPDAVELYSWIDNNHQLFDALRVERNVMFFILIIVVVVAAFSIMNTLITVTMQKTREIGIMKALGATSSQIVWVFLSLGMLVDLLGTVCGLGLAMVLLHFRNTVKIWLANTFHIEIFPASIYQFSEIPAETVPRDVLVICLSAFVICSLAAFIPAYLAARLDPVKALRFE